MAGGTQNFGFHGFAHETGHALGANHAGLIRADPTTSGIRQGVFLVGDICTYGDPISVMGGANAGTNTCNAKYSGSGHLSAMHKMRMGAWVDPLLDLFQFAPGSPPCDVTLAPVSTQDLGASGAQRLIEIPRGNMNSLFVEFRYPEGDFEIPTTLDHVGIPVAGGALLYVRPLNTESDLIDPIPDAGWGVNGPIDANSASLLLGESYIDPCSNVQVTIASIDPPSGSGGPATMRVHLQSMAGGSCAFGGSASIAFQSPPTNARLPEAGPVVVKVSGYSDIANVQVKLFAILSDHAILLGQGPPNPVTDEVSFNSLSWPPLPLGPLRLTAKMTETPVNCCEYSVTSSQNYRLHIGIPPGPGPTTVLGSIPSGNPLSRPFQLQATASSESGVASVEFWVDPAYTDTCGTPESYNGAHPSGCKYLAYFPAYAKNFPQGAADRGGFLLGVTTDAPYEITVSSLPPGTYSIWCRSHGVDGGVTITDPIDVVVTGDVPFAVDMSPSDGATVGTGQALTLQATVTAEEGEDGYVDFFADGVLVGTDDAAPYAMEWVVSGGPGETHALRVDAYGIGGRTASASVTVTGE